MDIDETDSATPLRAWHQYDTDEERLSTEQALRGWGACEDGPGPDGPETDSTAGGLYLTWIPDALRAGGCRVREEPGARTRGHGGMIAVRGLLCLEGGAIVLTARGFVPISDVTTHDAVWTHRHRWRPVTAIQRHRSPVGWLRAMGVDLLCTPEHPWLDRAGQWTPTDKVKSLRHGTPDIAETDAPTLPSGRTFTPAMASVVGAWLADGTVIPEQRDPNGAIRSYSRLRINPGSHKVDPVLDWVQQSGLPMYRSADHSNAATIELPDREFTAWVTEQFGRGSHGKRVPAWLLCTPKHADALLTGYLHGDGHWVAKAPGRDHWRFGTTSRSLAIGLLTLARQDGAHGYIACRKPPGRPGEINGIKFDRLEYWEVDLYDSPPSPPRPSVSSYEDGDLVVPVRSYSHQGVQDVYDITVAEDHSMLVDGVWSHNCHHTGSASMPGSRNVVRDGRSDLPGPLAHLTLDPDGTFSFIAAGQCWHPGRGGPLLDCPRDNGSPYLVGIEGVSGGTHWTPEQRREYPKGVAAILRRLGARSAEGWVAGHKEWAPTRKVDPGSWSMNEFRAEVNRHLRGAPTEEDFMASLSEDEKREFLTKVREIHKQMFGPWDTWRFGVEKQERRSLVDLIRGIDLEMVSQLDLAGRPGPEADTMLGQAASIRADVRALRTQLNAIEARLPKAPAS